MTTLESFWPYFGKSTKLLSITLFILLSFGFDSYSQNFPAGFSRVKVFNGRIIQPTAFAFSPDGRIFLTEQAGRVRIIKNGILNSTSFVEIEVSNMTEHGLFGIAIDPDFASNHYVYVAYTLPDVSHNRISRFTANGDVAVPGSETVILDLDPLSSAVVHNGGHMQFGPDKTLYIAVGENANPTKAQELDTYFGKIIRINRDGSVPAGNPYTSGSPQRKRLWAFGLRNPYTFNIQPNTGKIFINDVGSGNWEEINDATVGGRNFGWPLAEGFSNNTSFTNPVYAYQHGEGNDKGCAITGGTFFNPKTSNYPAKYVGKYFFLDYCNNWINMLDLSNPVTKTTFATNAGERMVYFDVGPDGNLYYLTRVGPASLYKIIYSEDQAPVVNNQPENVTVSAGQPATFTVSASGTLPLTYQWQKNGNNIAGAKAAIYTISSTKASDAGNYRVIINNDFGQVISNVATLTVTGFNAAPTAKISIPSEDKLYQGGQVIEFSGTGTDAEDGNLPASAFTWEVVFHHDTHVHDGPPLLSGSKTGSFTIPNIGETSDNVWYRLYLTVKDAGGLEGSTFVDIFPRKTTMRFKTQPEGLTVTLDGQPFATTYTVVGVEGILRSIGVISPQTVNGKTYVFDSWRHGGSQVQTISTPVNYTTYMAFFKESSTASLPAPWMQTDVGGTSIPGSASYTNGGFEISGSGSDIWRKSDEFHFVYQSLDADGEILGKIANIKNTNPWAKTGFMIREDLNGKSRYGGIFITPEQGIYYQRRTDTGDITTAKNRGGTIPQWLKLTREGTLVIGYKSSDGENWLKVGSMNLNVAGTVLIGMVVCSHNPNELGTSRFESVTVNKGNLQMRQLLAGNSNKQNAVTQPSSESITEIGLNHSLEYLLFPNPASNQIHLIGNDFSPDTSLTLMDITGRKTDLKINRQGDNSILIDTSILPNGIYTLSFRQGNHSIFKRVLIYHY